MYVNCDYTNYFYFYCLCSKLNFPVFLFLLLCLKWSKSLKTNSVYRKSNTTLNKNFMQFTNTLTDKKKQTKKLSQKVKNRENKLRKIKKASLKAEK